MISIDPRCCLSFQGWTVRDTHLTSVEICIMKQLKDKIADQTDAKEAEEDLKTDHAAKTAAKEEDVALVMATLEANLTLLRWRA